MKIEFEAKFYPVDKNRYRKKLKKVGAKLMVPERKMRTVLAYRQDNPLLTCDYIRVRDEGNLIRLSAKIHAVEGGKLSDQKETDVTVNDFDKAVEILKRSGLKFNFYQEKLRETWEYLGAEIIIDTWPGLEAIFEIEAGSEREVKQIAESLDFAWDKKILTSAAGLFGKIYNLKENEVMKKINNITFDTNPFVGMKKYGLNKL